METAAAKAAKVAKEKQTLHAIAVSTVQYRNMCASVCAHNLLLPCIWRPFFFVRFLFVFVTDPNSFGRGEHGAYEQYIYVYSLVSSWCVGIKLSRFLFRMCMIIWHDNSIQWMNNSNHEIIGHLRNKMTDHKSKHFLQITFLCICNQLKSHFTFFFLNPTSTCFCK